MESIIRNAMREMLGEKFLVDLVFNYLGDFQAVCAINKISGVKNDLNDIHNASVKLNGDIHDLIQVRDNETKLDNIIVYLHPKHDNSIMLNMMVVNRLLEKFKISNEQKVISNAIEWKQKIDSLEIDSNQMIYSIIFLVSQNQVMDKLVIYHNNHSSNCDIYLDFNELEFRVSFVAPRYCGYLFKYRLSNCGECDQYPLSYPSKLTCRKLNLAHENYNVLHHSLLDLLDHIERMAGKYSAEKSMFRSFL